MPQVIDLRSDTVTRPSAAMRKAMAEAEVGDDVLDGDPTTRRLEERLAELLGKGAALFFPSGTQANQTGIRLVTRPGTELLLEADAHLLSQEAAGLAANSGVQVRPVASPDGVLTVELLRPALRPDSPFYPRISAITIENTHSAAGGTVTPLAVSDAVGALAESIGVPLHLDGARLWNAATALGVPLARCARPARTVMVSFSKALGCPVGSCLAFPKEARRDAWEIRKRLGGGMRQSGILAAAALYALDHNVERIAEDHAHAKALAAGLRGHPALTLALPQSNVVMIDLTREGETAESVIAKLAEKGVKVAPYGPRRLRAVTHLDVTERDIDQAVHIIGEVLQ